jgi:hypothetical protein
MHRDTSPPVLLFLTGLLAGQILTSIFIFHWFSLYPGTSPKMAYHEYVSVLLTGIAVILAVLALFIAALAVWGYSQFKEMTRSASAAHLEKMLSAGKFREDVELLIANHVVSQLDGSDLRQILTERVDKIIQGDAEKRASGDTKTNDTDFRD